MMDDISYAVSLYRQLHEYPELAYDLPLTLALVKGELDRWGIPYSEAYGPSSIVATINPDCIGFTIGLRADMDALPIEEKTCLSFSSKHHGIMHACGHDVHTANLLAVGRWLKAHEKELRCRVKLLFTPAEEYNDPGCRHMVENGVTDDLDCIVGSHVESDLPVGTIGLLEGGINANSMGVTIDLYGKSSHAALPQKGVDAIGMAFQFYQAALQMKAREINPQEACVVHIGAIHGGKVQNNVCDHVQLTCSLRSQTDALKDFLLNRVRELAEGIAAMNGGSATVTVNKLLPYVYNDTVMYCCLKETAERALGAEHVVAYRRTMGGEDFGFLSRKKPSVFFRFGIRGGPETSYGPHTDHFRADEACFATSFEVFRNFVLDHQDGIADLPKTVQVV